MASTERTVCPTVRPKCQTQQQPLGKGYDCLYLNMLLSMDNLINQPIDSFMILFSNIFETRHIGYTFFEEF